MQNFQILCRIWKHVNSAKHRIAIASKTGTGQYGSCTLLRQVYVQSDDQCKWTDSWDVVPKLGMLGDLRGVKYHCTRPCGNLRRRYRQLTGFLLIVPIATPYKSLLTCILIIVIFGHINRFSYLLTYLLTL